MCWKSKDGGATKMTLYGLQFQHLKDLIVLKPFEMNSKKNIIEDRFYVFFY